MKQLAPLLEHGENGTKRPRAVVVSRPLQAPTLCAQPDARQVAACWWSHIDSTARWSRYPSRGSRPPAASGCRMRPRCCHQAPSIGAEPDGSPIACIARQLSPEGRALPKVPQTRRAVEAADGDAAAVRAERQPLIRRYGPLAGGDFPHLSPRHATRGV